MSFHYIYSALFKEYVTMTGPSVILVPDNKRFLQHDLMGETWEKDTYKVVSLGVLDGFSVSDRNFSSLPFNCGIQGSYTPKHPAPKKGLSSGLWWHKVISKKNMRQK